MNHIHILKEDIFKDKEFCEYLNPNEQELKNLIELGVVSQLKLTDNFSIQNERKENIKSINSEKDSLAIDTLGNINLMTKKENGDFDFLELEDNHIGYKGKDFYLRDKEESTTVKTLIEEVDNIEKMSDYLIERYEKFYSIPDIEYEEEIDIVLEKIQGYKKQKNNDLDDLDSMISDRKNDYNSKGNTNINPTHNSPER